MNIHCNATDCMFNPIMVCSENPGRQLVTILTQSILSNYDVITILSYCSSSNSDVYSIKITGLWS